MPCHVGRDSRPAPGSRPTRRRGSLLWRSRDGLAALEFAFIAPVLLIILAGLYDLTTGFIAWQRVNMAAQSIDQIATAYAAAAANTNTLNLNQAVTASSAVYAYLPDTMSASPPAFGVTISSVVMTNTSSTCTAACTYTAHVAWSGVYQGSAATSPRRPCDSPPGTSARIEGSDATSPSSTTLPADVYTAAPLLVVDVNYTFRPLFLTFVTANVTMTRSAYFPPRTGLTSNWIKYYFAGAPDATTLCSGYPAATTN